MGLVPLLVPNSLLDYYLSLPLFWITYIIYSLALVLISF